MTILKITACGLAAVVWSLAPPSIQAQITTNTALPVATGEVIIRIQAKYRQAVDGGTNNRELRVFAIPVVGAYGVTQRTTVFVSAPFAHKELKTTIDGTRVSRQTSAIGDLRIFGRRTVYQVNQKGLTFRVAPFAGIELPTGSSQVTDEFGEIPPGLQPGSGSWDPFLGVVISRLSFKSQFDVSIGYTRNTTADKFKFGDELNLDVASKFRILPREIGTGLPNFVYVNLESNLAWLKQNETRGTTDVDSGGLTWHLAPGSQFVTRRVIIETAVQIPVVQNLNGLALKNDFIFTLSTRISM